MCCIKTNQENMHWGPFLICYQRFEREIKYKIEWEMHLILSGNATNLKVYNMTFVLLCFQK